MKNIQYYLLGILLCSMSDAYSLTAITVCNGLWDSPSTWSSGAVPVNEDTIIIEHLVKNVNSLTLTSNLLIIKADGELCGNVALNLAAGTVVNNYGVFGATSITLADYFYNNGTIKTNSFVISGYLVNNGSMAIGGYSCFEKPDCTPHILLTANDSLRSNTEAYSYEWSLDGNVLAETTRNIEPVSSGDYTVRTKSILAVYSDYSSIHNVNLTSIDNADLSQKPVSIWSNGNTITIKGKGRATIFNLQGQRVHQSKLTGNTSISLDKGIYLVRVTNEGRSVTKKVYLTDN